ncbi:MAG: 5-oxoprolinase subunit PxpB [Crocinitomicaceae bacterium]
MLKPKIIQYGENCLLLNWPEKINIKIHQIVLNYQSWIEKEHSNLIQETNIGYQSLLVILKNEPDILNLIFQIERVDLQNLSTIEITKYLYTIPVCYDTSFGLDIETLAHQKNIRISELIEMHTAQIYKVYFTGFLPGFMYLGGLTPSLHSPRLSRPRLEIPKGSVGIGGGQTGIYPQDSPGGWQIVGRTPLKLFEQTSNVPVLCKPGDYVQFENISLSEFQTIERQVQLNGYKIRKEIKDD